MCGSKTVHQVVDESEAETRRWIGDAPDGRDYGKGR